MTRKDYENIADIIREAKKEQDAQYMIQYIESAFQCLFASDNPRFDHDKFKQACQLKDYWVNS